MIMASRSSVKSLGGQLMALIARADRLAFRDLAAALAPLGVTLADFRVVGALMGEAEGLGQKELASRLGIEPATLSVALAKLERAGHVERTVAEHDSRARVVRLAAGAAAFPDVLAQVADLERRAAAGISDKDLAVTRRVLQRVIENLDPRPGADGPKKGK